MGQVVHAWSPLTPPACRYTPSCSLYTLQAIELWGVWGVWLCAGRERGNQAWLAALAAPLGYTTTLFAGNYNTILSFVIVGFVWKLILSPTWGVTSGMLKSIGLGFLFQPWLGKEEYALTTLALISVWQFIGIPMMLIYAALLSIPDEILEAAEMDGITGMSQFWKIKLPLILPSIGIISILTFVGNFNAFDLIYVAQGALAGPDYATDILGTFLYRTFFGFQLQLGDPYMGSAIAGAMFGIILIGVCVYLFGIQTRLRRYQF